MAEPIEFPIKNFLGLNVRDAGDRIRDNEFTQLQNVYQPQRGTLSLRFGTTDYGSGKSIPLANRISGIWRHYTPLGDKTTLYHCEPDTNLLPDNTSDLVLTEVLDGLGYIYGGSLTITTLRFCYSWIGAGLEQTYNSKNRSGFPSSFPVNAWDNPAHQTIFPVGLLSTIQVTVPTFPAGVRGANIFMSRGTSTQMTFMGTVTASGGSLMVRSFTGPLTSASDPMGSDFAVIGAKTGGSLQPGTYYVVPYWIADYGNEEGIPSPDNAPAFTTPATLIKQVAVLPGQDSIVVTAPSSPSSPNSARAIYVFISSQDPRLHSASWVGNINIGGSSTYGSIPSTNAQTIPFLMATDNPAIYPLFFRGVNDQYVGTNNVQTGGRQQVRAGFLLADDGTGSLREVFPSRTLFAFAWQGYNPFIPGDPFSGTNPATFQAWVQSPKTANDRYMLPSDSGFTQPYSYSKTINDPQFCYALGMSYFVNGGDIPWQTDGQTLCQIGKVLATTGTILPPAPSFIQSYQDGLVTSGGDQRNQVYGSNAAAPNNWATGGDGTLLRFVTVGDADGTGVTASGIFTPATEATSNPNSYLVNFKKNGCWMISNIPDPILSTLAGNVLGQAPTPMIQISGRVGCTAYRTVVNTPLGLVFLAQDANVYMINSVSEPRRIGTKVQNDLIHLVPNDSWMRQCTAVYHDNHLKISYPSPAATLSSPVVNDSQLWLDLRTEDGDPTIWAGPHVGIGIAAQIVQAGETDDLSRIGVNSSTGWAIKLDDTSTLQDLGSNIIPIIKSKLYRFNAETRIKRYFGAYLDIFLDSGFKNTLLFTALADEFYGRVPRDVFPGQGATWDVSKWDGSAYADQMFFGISMLLGQTNLIGRTFQWTLTHEQGGVPFALESVVLLMSPERRRIIR